MRTRANLIARRHDRDQGSPGRAARPTRNFGRLKAAANWHRLGNVWRQPTGHSLPRALEGSSASSHAPSAYRDVWCGQTGWVISYKLCRVVCPTCLHAIYHLHPICLVVPLTSHAPGVRYFPLGSIDSGYCLGRTCHLTLSPSGTQELLAHARFFFSVENAVCKDSYRRQCRRNGLLKSLPTMTSARILTVSVLWTAFSQTAFPFAGAGGGRQGGSCPVAWRGRQPEPANRCGPDCNQRDGMSAGQTGWVISSVR